MRRFKRIAYTSALELILSNNERESVTTVDLSQGGICFIARRPLKADSEVEVKLRLLKKQKTIYAQVKVSWIKKLDRLKAEDVEQYKVGIEFVHIEAADKRLLSEELKLYNE